MHKKFEINRTKSKGGCQSGRKLVPHNSKIDLPPKTEIYSLRLHFFSNTSLYDAEKGRKTLWLET